MKIANTLSCLARSISGLNVQSAIERAFCESYFDFPLLIKLRAAEVELRLINCMSFLPEVAAAQVDEDAYGKFQNCVERLSDTSLLLLEHLMAYRLTIPQLCPQPHEENMPILQNIFQEIKDLRLWRENLIIQQLQSLPEFAD